MTMRELEARGERARVDPSGAGAAFSRFAGDGWWS